MTTKNNEIELVKNLKNSFPDMLDFNNCLKELRTFWRKEMLDDEIDFIFQLEDYVRNNNMEEVGIMLQKRLSKLKCAKDNL